MGLFYDEKGEIVLEKNIKIYSNGCPKCRVLEAKLGAKNIEYDKTQNIEELSEKNFNSLPVLMVGDRYLNFVEANDWVNAQV